MTDAPTLDAIRMTPVTELVQHKRNPNQGDVGEIAASIETSGWWGTVVARVGTNEILAGNHRVQAAAAVGIEQIPVYFVDVDDDTATRILLGDNRLTRLGIDDPEELTSLLVELAATTDGLLGTGFDDDDLDHLLRYGADDNPLDPPGKKKATKYLVVVEARNGDDQDGIVAALASIGLTGRPETR